MLVREERWQGAWGSRVLDPAAERRVPEVGVTLPVELSFVTKKEIQLQSARRFSAAVLTWHCSPRPPTQEAVRHGTFSPPVEASVPNQALHLSGTAT